MFTFIRSLLPAIGCIALVTSALAREPPVVPAPDAARLKARALCSCLFVQKMSMAQCADGRSAIWRYLFAGTPRLVEEGQRVVTTLEPAGATVQLFDKEKLLAQSRFVEDGGGCVSLECRAGQSCSPPQPAQRIAMSEPAPLPRGALPPAVDAKVVQQTLDEGFAPGGPLLGHARAVYIVHDDKVVVERYAPGYGPQNAYYLGSVSKIFNNLLAGLLVRDGRLDLADKVARPQWQSRGDARSQITVDHMLHMMSGLGWKEDFFTPGAPAYEIYFGGSRSDDVARAVAERASDTPPGTKAQYSTGSSAVLAAALQARIGGTTGGRAALLQYFSKQLFEPIGATGVTPEFDAAGTFLAGHGVFARPEDLARIGLLYLHDGQWQGRRILPEGWVKYSTQPVQGGSTAYGAHLVLDVAQVPGCFGHPGVGGQKLIVCPRLRLVVVWFSSNFDFFSAPQGDIDATQRELLLAFPEAPDGGGR